VALAAGVLLVAACSPVAASPSPSSDIFTVTGPEADKVALVVRFVTAFNAARLDDASALLTDDAGISDCDYVTHTVVLAQGKTAVRTWLGQRFADHDQLVIADIFNMNPDPNSNRGAGVDFARRTSDTIARLGAPHGLVQDLGAKVVIDESGQKIRGFAMGPFGADPGIVLRTCSVPGPTSQASGATAARPVGLFQSDHPVGTGSVGSRTCVGLRLDDLAYRTGAVSIWWWLVGPAGCHSSTSGLTASQAKLVPVSLPGTSGSPDRAGYRVELDVPLIPTGSESVLFTLDPDVATPGQGVPAYPGPTVSQSVVLLVPVPELDVRGSGGEPAPTPRSP
jgi:hypothetical protein